MITLGILKRVLYRVIEWVCCFNEYDTKGYSGVLYKIEIVRIKKWNVFLVDYVTKSGLRVNRMNVCPVWNLQRFKYLFWGRFIPRKE